MSTRRSLMTSSRFVRPSLSIAAALLCCTGCFDPDTGAIQNHLINDCGVSLFGSNCGNEEMTLQYISEFVDECVTTKEAEDCLLNAECTPGTQPELDACRSSTQGICAPDLNSTDDPCIVNCRNELSACGGDACEPSSELAVRCTENLRECLELCE